jgi:hypothetical protein
MYFYTDLKGGGGHGLAGVNIHTGAADRAVRLSDLDERFITDEVAGMLFSANGNRLIGYSVAPALSKLSPLLPARSMTASAAR